MTTTRSKTDSSTRCSTAGADCRSSSRRFGSRSVEGPGSKWTGVSLPGHFLVFAGGQLVDPFHFGEAIGSDEAASLVAESMGASPAWNRPGSPRWEPGDPEPDPRQPGGPLSRASSDRDNLAWVEACQEVL